MSKEFRLPDLGEGVMEGQILRVLVGEGDHVTEDQPLLEVETDKASVEIPSPHTGIVSGVHIIEQQIVNVGDLLVTFDGGSEAKASDVEVKPTAATTIKMIPHRTERAMNSRSASAMLLMIRDHPPRTAGGHRSSAVRRPPPPSRDRSASKALDSPRRPFEFQLEPP